ncbi:hypothetical protein KZZ52_41660 [Dactylosporangium sp. AC04546]|uniref:hypothetical protein n=1 Tax=Dactylosporangium sp. AC04546 TaxID=2862460 RepID=UPI001EDE37CE|nr:hypothetical protein [Dactylosporangium sp. AC04546]WVK80433.1 hypothetical protein KZZ52_41660 [Dactylosporangium sp. AC04546]
MLVHLYSQNASRNLAASVVAAARVPHQAGARPDDALLIGIGGGWELGNWREELRQLAARNAVNAFAVRTLPTERRLTDAEWTTVARGLADQIGRADDPLAVVWTTPTSSVLFVEASNRSLHRDRALAFVGDVTIRLQRGETVAMAVRAAGSHGIAQASPGDVTALNFAEPANASPTAAPQPAPVPAPPTIVQSHTR